MNSNPQVARQQGKRVVDDLPGYVPQHLFLRLSTDTTDHQRPLLL